MWSCHRAGVPPCGRAIVRACRHPGVPYLPTAQTSITCNSPGFALDGGVAVAELLLTARPTVGLVAGQS
jgi:hypothetical protein